ncbi:MAG: helix-turn-helix domain-containing protein [Lachnospiraceae bacterium]|jgi:carbohydrate diacid regulator|nr:helix-turn-helix domain-containing protein [Lachnospiraceae bacterium]
MNSSQIIKNTISELNVITKTDFSVFDPDGNLITATEESHTIDRDVIRLFGISSADSQVVGVNHLLKIKDDDQVIYILNVIGDADNVYMMGRIAISQIQNMLGAYKEKIDRNSFFQNLILDNFLLVDVYNRAKKLHIEASVPRVVILVETGGDKDTAATELLRGMYSHQGGDYVTTVDERNIIVIKSLAENEGYEQISQIAHTIVDMMNMEALMNVRVAYGTIVQELRDVSKSYKEATMAQDVGKIFFFERKVNAYNTLGIGRLIYQLPVKLCKMFIDEIFRDTNPQDIDEEILMSVNKFFENSLNVSETSRQLFVHRNTLVYRIEKLEASTGLDVRTFDDALTFKIAMMVVNYMRYLDTISY